MIIRRYMILFLIVIEVLFVASCSKKNNLSEFDCIRDNAINFERLMEKHLFLNESIIFELNEYKLSPIAKKLLRNKADWLFLNTNYNVVVEGYCDSLGESCYNIILGAKRADKVKSFLIELGIPNSRMRVVSYGETKIIDDGTNEEQLIKNRRVRFSFFEK